MSQSCLGNGRRINVPGVGTGCQTYQETYDCNLGNTNTNVIPGISGTSTGAVTLTSTGGVGAIHDIQNQQGDNVSVIENANGNLETISEVEQDVLRAPLCTGTPASILPESISKVNRCIITTNGLGSSAIALEYTIVDSEVNCQIEGMLVGQDTASPNNRFSIGFTLNYGISGNTLVAWDQTQISYRKIGDPDHSLDLITVTQTGGSGNPIQINIVDNSTSANVSQWTMKNEKICVQQLSV